VTLEDLLRLKRAEQPPAEFWAEFERGMRAKQLAAIVEPRPWWAPFIRVGTRISRYQLPVGATAILAITLFTIREYHPVSSSSSFESTASETASVPAPVTIGEEANPSDAVTAPAESNAVEVATNEQAPAIDTSPSRSDQASIAAATPVGEASHVAMVNSELSSARYVAELAAAQPADPALDQMLGHPLRSVENSPARGEPLAQISVPGESRLYRLLGGTARLASASTGDSALRMNEQAARHLTERRLAESDVIRRLDVGGNQVTVKF
jgi:hypothetical protein